MNPTLLRLKAHFINWREWELNPIVIKELRQGVRSWTVTGMLLLFLVVLFLASLGFLVTQSVDMTPNMRLGASMFSTFIVILAGASVFFIPLYTGIRVATERQENNPDLLYVTTLSPTRIILGKFLCSAYIALLFFSACMPFMAFTNLLRGVDLPTVFFILAFLYLVVCVVNMAAIFLACLPASRPFKILFVLAGFFASSSIIVPLVRVSFEMMGSGVGAMMARRAFWINALTFACVEIAVAGLFFVLAVALISPPSANRALPVRIYLTLFWLFGGLAALASVARSGYAEGLYVWTAPTFALMVASLLVVISNSDHFSRRVRRRIPVSGFKRFLAFLFFNGAAGGLGWVAGIVVATYEVMVLVGNHLSHGAISDDVQRTYAATAEYAFAYCLTALFLHRKFLPRRPPKLSGLLAVLLAGAWAVAPSIFLFFANRFSWTSIEGLQLGNVFNVYFNRNSGQLIYHELFAGVWLLIMILLNLKWFGRRLADFQPTEKMPALAVPSEAGMPPVISP